MGPAARACTCIVAAAAAVVVGSRGSSGVVVAFAGSMGLVELKRPIRLLS